MDESTGDLFFSSHAPKCDLDADFAGLSSTQIFLEVAGLGSWMQACHRPFTQAL